MISAPTPLSPPDKSSRPAATSIVPVLVTAAAIVSMPDTLVSAPALVSVPPPVMDALVRSSDDPLATFTRPPLLVTVVDVSLSLLLLIACSVPVLVTGSPVISSSPPLASSVPELIRVTTGKGGSIVSVPAVDSIMPVLVIPALSMELSPVESIVP